MFLLETFIFTKTILIFFALINTIKIDLTYLFLVFLNVFLLNRDLIPVNENVRFLFKLCWLNESLSFLFITGYHLRSGKCKESH